ncbi:cupin domain-containing protein [Chitinimonas arctica]|uniref:Cupin domain-containing protein n=1 Tax=Chitinimonas arctica TaxID=2594795 RepID=A0A516SCK5_9NEIS|nr:cupin domain-containing protein [Chitinimonas arctica]QDQ25883.1 cupin domain-containing protein [Chitinimonas arctica]
MQTFHLDAISQDRQTHSQPYHEFLRARDMSAGLYHLQPGNHDAQGAHQEDLLFYVIRGHATLQVDDDRIAVQAGSIVHVPAKALARFSEVTAALDVLVVFAPAESVPTVETRRSV